MSTERLQKILAQAGIASRRKAEEMITAGEVTVNGKVAKIGDKADYTVDHIKVNGTLVRQVEDHFYVLFNKPKGVISMMSDPEGRPTLADFLAKLKVHVNPIGRLDFNSEGLILLTNDGGLAEKIQKSDLFPRVYHVKVKGHITTEMITRLERGARIANKFVKANSVRIKEELNKKTKIEIVFLNAANVDVKAFFEAKGFLVEKITRTGIGHLTLHGLEPGKHRLVPKTKFEALVEQPELGVKAIEHRHEKERSILPRDQRLRNVDEFGKVVLPVTSDDDPRKVVIKPGRAPSAGAASKAAGRSAGPRPVGKKKENESIIVRARDSEDGTPRSKRAPAKAAYSGVDMPSFKRREAPARGATRFGADRPQRDTRRSGGEFGAKPKFSSDRKPGFGDRKPRSDSGDRKAFGDRKPSFGSERKGSFGSERKGSFGDKKPSFGGERKSFGDRKPSFGGERKSSFEDRKPSFGGDRKPRAGGPSKPRFSEGRGGSSRPSSAGRAPIARVKRRER